MSAEKQPIESEGDSLDSLASAAEAPSFHERLSTIPAYTSTLSSLSWLYSGVKGKSETLNSALTTGEGYFATLSNVASAATNTALYVAKPVVGDNPVGKIDSMASEALAKVQERFPVVNHAPGEIAQATLESIQAKGGQVKDAVVGKVVHSAPVVKLEDSCQRAISASELVVEFCFPTDGSNYDDILELERAEEDEDKGVFVRASNLKARVRRRGTKKIMSYKVVEKSVDFVQYAQERIQDMNDKLRQGTNYAKSGIEQGASMIQSTRDNVDIRGMTEQVVNAGVDVIDGTVDVMAKLPESTLAKGAWDQVYTTSMYIPKKALQITGEVLVSTTEVVFAYTKVHHVNEMPRAVVAMAEKYYSDFKAEQPLVSKIEEKVVAFVTVPAQVVAVYARQNRAIQWIVPSVVTPDQIQVVQEHHEMSALVEAEKEMKILMSDYRE